MMHTTKLIKRALILLLVMPAAAMSNSPLVEPAQAVVSHAPRYPQPAIVRGLEGVVLLKVEIDASGEPSHIVVENENVHPILRDAAVRSVKRWQFAPGTSDGKPVRSTLEIPIRFELVAERSYSSSVLDVWPHGGR